MKYFLSIFFLINFQLQGTAQLDTVVIRTSSVCEMCKELIEKELSFEKGVKKSILDIRSKDITVIYNPEKTTPEKIKQAITRVGYDADSLPADPKAYKRLPDCCKKESGIHDKIEN